MYQSVRIATIYPRSGNMYDITLGIERFSYTMYLVESVETNSITGCSDMDMSLRGNNKYHAGFHIVLSLDELMDPIWAKYD